MFEKLKLFYQAMQVGGEVLNPEAWKVHQVTANKVALLLTVAIGLANSFGVKIDVDNQTILAVAGGLFAATNWIFTLVTSKKVGLPITTLTGVQSVAGSLPEASVAAAPEAMPPVSQSNIDEAKAAMDAARGR